MTPFTLERDAVTLPMGAWAKTERHTLRYRGAPVCAFTQGVFRAYLYPVYTPAGFAVTEESPADHSHHNSVWVGADHVHCRFPLAGHRVEEGTYNFYVNEPFQGRAPGRIEQVALESLTVSDRHARVTQTLDWRGPVEWAAPAGRVLARETRVTDVRPGNRAHLVTLTSRLAPTDWDLVLGPTRHAYFGVRVAESMRVIGGGTLIDADGRRGGDAVTGALARWIDYTGPVSARERAGIVVVPGREPPVGPWFATDWGTIAVNPLAVEARRLVRGDTLELRVGLAVHDGELTPAEIQDIVDTELEGGGP